MIFDHSAITAIHKNTALSSNPYQDTPRHKEQKAAWCRLYWRDFLGSPKKYF
jgi:hypothetical protein